MPAAASTTVPRLALTSTDAAAAIGIDPGTLRNWRSQGRGPRYVRIGGNKVLYRVADLESWLDAAQAAGGAK